MAVGDRIKRVRNFRGMTMKELGFPENFAESTECHWHWIDKGVYCQTPDIYLSSANGLSETGEIVNIDGSGNRLASMLYGHEALYIVAGVNKLAPDLPAAIGRSISGAAIVVALLAAAAFLFRRVHGCDGVGAGDIKLLGALGLWAGPVGGLAVVGASCLIALAGRAAVLWVRQSASRVALCRDGSMPMAPAISAAALLTYALGLWAW